MKKRDYSQRFLKQNQPFLHITDDNRIENLTFDELKNTIGNFNYSLYFTYHNIQKKIKTSLQKDFSFN